MKRRLPERASIYFNKRPVAAAICMSAMAGVLADSIYSGSFSTTNCAIWILVGIYFIWGYSHELGLKKKKKKKKKKRRR